LLALMKKLQVPRRTSAAVPASEPAGSGAQASLAVVAVPVRDIGSVPASAAAVRRSRG
jgi:hypothetical protein